MNTSNSNYHNPNQGRKSRSKDYCGKYFLRNVLFVFNIIFFLTGLSLLGVGLYIRLNRHTFVSLLGSTTYPVSTYLLLATGAVIILTGVLGCFGACKYIRCCLFTFAFLLLLIFLLEAVAGVLAYMYDGVVKEELTRNLNKTMMDNYMYDIAITQAVDEMQQQFQCCGTRDFQDWRYSKWKKNENDTRVTPDSCCKTPSLMCALSDSPNNIYYLGCSIQLEYYTKHSLILIGGIGLGLCCVQVFGIIFSCCLIRKIKESKRR
ncbi:hypothetical protein CHS0354_011521 [Potamilus streckersoni]|uniref:Tetraspanin n=1 Tax=Potamilus streckersoni TaxID=2493646 RepID=A0AAE0SM27_9BIVA|nr:hypothetical protein CHS0354_011521 [Potamilus streckersoni]